MEHEPLRLIEDCLPLDLISERATREKRAGSLSALHLWWGRKPQVAARAAIYAALVPAPADQTQRAAYLRQLDALCALDVPESVVIQARRQLAEVHRERVRAYGAGTVPLVVDLFAGGGTIPLEALRLGCATVAGDLNPVAYLIQRCTLDYPQRYPGLGALVRSWGQHLIAHTRRAVAHLFPAMPRVHDARAHALPLGDDHTQDFIPDAYLWTRSGKLYRLRFRTNKQQLFRAFRPLQNLADKAGTLEVTVEIVARSDTPLDASWLRNAVEEPLDEADVTFEGGLES